jgi:fatty acid desaturase
MQDYRARTNLIPAERLRALTDRSDRAGALQAASHFGAIALTGTLLHHLWGTAWAVPVFMLHGMLINFLFAAQHECNHYTAFRTRWMNDVINRITGFVLLYPRSYERWYHFEHHRHTQDWECDPELMGRPLFTLGSYLVYLFGISYWWSLVRRMFANAFGAVSGDYFTDPQRRHVVLEARWHLAGYLLIAVLSLSTGSALAVTLWLAPMLLMKITHQVQNITEHTAASHVSDTLVNTRTIRTWPVLRWMGWNMQYHTAHHTYPAVPFHRLPELHSEIVERLGHELPTASYVAFQREFLATLVRGREPRDGLAATPDMTGR